MLSVVCHCAFLWAFLGAVLELEATTAFAPGLHLHRKGTAFTIRTTVARGVGRCRCAMTVSSRKASDEFVEHDDDGVKFGLKDYWEGEYHNASKRIKEVVDESDGEGSFSWYTGWADLEPFFSELVPDRSSSRILIPGIGNDAAMVDMFDSGYARMTAFDYSPEGVECARRMFGRNRDGVELCVADARDLPFSDASFDAILEKGTLDAIYLSGGKDKECAAQHLSMAMSELARVVHPGGIIFSISAACVGAVEEAVQDGEVAGVWEVVRDGSFYITEDGYASNNIDATIMALKKL